MKSVFAVRTMMSLPFTCLKSEINPKAVNADVGYSVRGAKRSGDTNLARLFSRAPDHSNRKKGWSQLVQPKFA